MTDNNLPLKAIVDPIVSFKTSQPQADARGLIRDMDGIASVEIIADGDNLPLVIWERSGKRYLAEVKVWDVTELAFFNKRDVFENLKKVRKISKDALDAASGDR